MRENFKSVSIATEVQPYIELMCFEMLRGMIDGIKDRGLTLSTAESCTGGLIGKILTDVPGVSAVYAGGIISYTNEVKISQLGVSVETIERYTEVSAETAREMAEGVRERLSTDIGISTTGFAGPDGGNETDPVGTVYIGVATKEQTKVLRLSLDGDSDRAAIRRAAAHVALMAVEKIVLKD